jgi:hypothetical protein
MPPMCRCLFTVKYSRGTAMSRARGKRSWRHFHLPSTIRNSPFQSRKPPAPAVRRPATRSRRRKRILRLCHQADTAGYDTPDWCSGCRVARQRRLGKALLDLKSLDGLVRRCRKRLVQVGRHALTLGGPLIWRNGRLTSSAALGATSAGPERRRGFEKHPCQPLRNTARRYGFLRIRKWVTTPANSSPVPNSEVRGAATNALTMPITAARTNNAGSTG